METGITISEEIKKNSKKRQMNERAKGTSVVESRERLEKIREERLQRASRSGMNRIQQRVESINKDLQVLETSVKNIERALDNTYKNPEELKQFNRRMFGIAANFSPQTESDVFCNSFSSWLFHGRFFLGRGAFTERTFQSHAKAILKNVTTIKTTKHYWYDATTRYKNQNKLNLKFDEAVLGTYRSVKASLRLIEAVKEKNYVDIDYLLKIVPLDINLQDNEGATALHHACRQNEVAIATALLLWGADEKKQNKKGKTPMQLCSSVSEESISKSYQEQLNHRQVLKSLLNSPRARIEEKIPIDDIQDYKVRIVTFAMQADGKAFLENLNKIDILKAEVRKPIVNANGYQFELEHREYGMIMETLSDKDQLEETPRLISLP